MMEQIQIEQTYDMASLTALCRVARKTVRTVARVVRGICWCILALDAVLTVLLIAMGGMPDVWMWAVLAALVLLLLSEDRLNAWIAKSQLVPGTAHSVTVFTEDDYTVTTDAAVTRMDYGNITCLCETERYFMLFLGKKHGQVFDKQGFQSGDPDAFRALLEKKTGKTFRKV